MHQDKMRMAAGIDGIVQNAQNLRYEESNHTRADDIVGFNRGNIRVSIKGSNGYSGDVLTAIYKDGKETFFDINNLARQEIEGASPERYAASGFTQTDEAPSESSIPDAAPKVNTENVPNSDTSPRMTNGQVDGTQARTLPAPGLDDEAGMTTDAIEEPRLLPTEGRNKRWIRV